MVVVELWGLGAGNCYLVEMGFDGRSVCGIHDMDTSE